MVLIWVMERIQPLGDHLRLRRFPVGGEVEFDGRRYTVVEHTTLASGEPAVVLRGGSEQFVIGASRFLAGVKEEG